MTRDTFSPNRKTYLSWEVYQEYLKCGLCADQLETSTSPPPPRGFWSFELLWTFEDWIVQIPAPSGQNGVQMPYLIVGFVCHTLLKNNRRRLLPFLIKTF